MEVILTQDVKSLGKKGQKVKVSDGYARNFLIPKGLASQVTASALNELKNREQAEKYRIEQELKKAKGNGETLSGKTVKVKANAGANGKLFGSVTAKDVAASISEQFGIDIDKRRITLADDIKNCGTYECEIKLHAQVTVNVYLVVGS
ncbi:MAG: 50S ribosomal protein L9 [Clostridiales bacterium]|nr:50S ribosomal protein L9 [Clostridiales bacterium]